MNGIEIFTKIACYKEQGVLILALIFVPGAGLEPARPSLTTGF